MLTAARRFTFGCPPSPPRGPCAADPTSAGSPVLQKFFFSLRCLLSGRAFFFSLPSSCGSWGGLTAIGGACAWRRPPGTCSRGAMTLAARTNFVVVLARAGRIAPTNEVMETLLPQLLSFPPHPQELSDHEYDRLIKALAQLLQETSASKLAKGVVGGGDLLDVSACSSISMHILLTCTLVDPGSCN